VPEFQDHIVALIPRLRRFAVALTGTLADGDDLLQSTVERALKRQKTFDNSKKLDSWMFKIAQNIWIDQKRAEGRRGHTVDILEAYDIVGEDGRSKMEKIEMSRKVMAIVSALPEPQRLVVAYILVDGQSYKETASLLGIPLGTVMSRLNRARKTLEGQLQEA